MLGLLLIAGSLILLFINHGIRRRGMWLVAFISVGAVGTISLYKYNITHFNSVEVEQGLAYFVLIVFFYLMARLRAKENPLRMLAHPVFSTQSLLAGVGGVIISFAYLFSAASVITTAKRALDIVFATLSGRLYFHEKKFWVKVLSFLLILVGLFLLT